MSASTDRITSYLRRVVEDAEHVLKDTTEVATEKAKAARERLAAAVEAAKACCQNVEEKAMAGAKVTDKVIREHPYQSIGIAFGVGVLIGWLVTRK